MRHVHDHGVAKADRTGTGTKSVFGHQMRFDLREGFPLVTTKKVHLKSIILELLWFLRGDGNARWLQERGVTIWDEWAQPDGDLGPVYGVQWRSWPTPDGGHIDQIAEVVEAAQDQPRLAPHHRQRLERRRAAEDGADAVPRVLPVLRRRAAALSCQLYQRSADIFLGVPFNIASYALLTHMLAQQCDLDVGDFIWTGGDCHIYSNHAEQVALQLSRAAAPVPDAGHQAPAGVDLRLRVRGLRGAGLRAPSGDQGAGRGVMPRATLAGVALAALRGGSRPRRRSSAGCRRMRWTPRCAAWNRPPASAAGLTRIGLQFWNPSADGRGVVLAPVDASGKPVTPADVTRFRDWAKKRGIPVLLTVYNHSQVIATVGLGARRATPSSDQRAAFTQALVAEMDRYGLDGIDLDLEGEGDSERRPRRLRELRARAGQGPEAARQAADDRQLPQPLRQRAEHELVVRLGRAGRRDPQHGLRRPVRRQHRHLHAAGQAGVRRRRAICSATAGSSSTA